MMKLTQNIYLVGLMGAGKSTVGRRLARALKVPFKDSDHVIEASTGVQIPLIFEMEGEEGFRDREAKVIDELTQQGPMVLATGGGAVLRDENRAALMGRGYVIYLNASINHLLNRTKNDTQRPLLQAGDPRKTFERLMLDRDPLYRQVADLVLVTENKPVGFVLSELLNKLKDEGVIH
jgi:shikimate kinase